MGALVSAKGGICEVEIDSSQSHPCWLNTPLYLVRDAPFIFGIIFSRSSRSSVSFQAKDSVGIAHYLRGREIVKKTGRRTVQYIGFDDCILNRDCLKLDWVWRGSLDAVYGWMFSFDRSIITWHACGRARGRVITRQHQCGYPTPGSGVA